MLIIRIYIYMQDSTFERGRIEGGGQGEDGVEYLLKRPPDYNVQKGLSMTHNEYRFYPREKLRILG